MFRALAFFGLIIAWEAANAQSFTKRAFASPGPIAWVEEKNTLYLVERKEGLLLLLRPHDLFPVTRVREKALRKANSLAFANDLLWVGTPEGMLSYRLNALPTPGGEKKFKEGVCALAGQGTRLYLQRCRDRQITLFYPGWLGFPLGQGKIGFIQALAADNDGVWVAQKGQILRFLTGDKNPAYILRGPKASPLTYPVALAVTPGRIVAADARRQDIRIYGKDGRLLGHIPFSMPEKEIWLSASKEGFWVSVKGEVAYFSWPMAK